MQHLSNLIYLACLLEASARKAGNVHPTAAFEHLTYEDFVRSAEVVAPILARATEYGVGCTILEAVRATRGICGGNPNLGIILLLAPLAVVPIDESIATGLPHVLQSCTVQDSCLVFEAIRLASPRGLGKSAEQDVSAAPTESLIDIMRLAAERDSIAAQYVTDFRFVQASTASLLSGRTSFAAQWEHEIIRLQLHLMATQPDTDIARKCDWDEAVESAHRARRVLDAGWPGTATGQHELDDFDHWLRARGSLRNPGTTADLVTACLFIALREQLVVPPSVEQIRTFVSDVRNQRY